MTLDVTLIARCFSRHVLAASMFFAGPTIAAPQP